MTQLNTIKRILLENGQVTRNEMLKMFISRLASRIKDLQKEGWIIFGKSIKTEYGRDYLYTLVSSPLKKVVYRVPALNKEIITYEQRN